MVTLTSKYIVCDKLGVSLSELLKNTPEAYDVISKSHINTKGEFWFSSEDEFYRRRTHYMGNLKVIKDEMFIEINVPVVYK